MSKVYDIDSIRGAIRTIFGTYWAGAAVIWAEQNAVKPVDYSAADSIVMLRMASVRRNLHEMEELQGADIVDYYNASIRIEVQLFTRGRKVQTSEGAYRVNTAVNDLEDFANFLYSTYADELMSGFDISVRLDSETTDISFIVDDAYEYRARQEYEVTCMLSSSGEAGISRTNWTQTASGGGTAALAGKNTASFVRVEANGEYIPPEDTNEE